MVRSFRTDGESAALPECHFLLDYRIKFITHMTTYRKKYNLDTEERKLLRDLLIYQISMYDSKYAAREEGPLYARRIAAFGFLKDIYSIELYGDDSVMIMMRDIIKLCNPLSEESRDNIRRRHVIEDDGGLRSILSIYSNETIQKLKSCLESEEGIMMTSTNSFCSLPRINLRDLDL